MLPNQSQKIKLTKWFGIYRYIYNQSLAFIKDAKRDRSKSLLQLLRDRFIKNENYLFKNQWVKDLPADTRDYAAKEVLQAFKTNLKKGHHFDLQYKSKKKSISIEIRQRQYNAKRKNGMYKFLSDIKKTETVPVLQHDIKIQMDSDGSFYLIIPMDVIRSENQVPHQIIAIDPGIRTLLTCYDPNGFIYHLGENDIGRLARLLHYKNKLQGKISQHTRHNKHRIRRAFKKIANKIKHLVDECHQKIAKWLLENFEYIILPKLDTNSFCRQKMSKVVKNKIKVWRHCSFVDRLKSKQREYPNSHLIIPTEEYTSNTSKTCSNCGTLHPNLGSKKEYECSCGSIFDRDVNGAFNILLKVLTEGHERLSIMRH